MATFKGKFPVIEKINGTHKKSVIVTDNSGKQEKNLEIVIPNGEFDIIKVNHFYEIEFYVYSSEYNGKWFSTLKSSNIKFIH